MEASSTELVYGRWPVLESIEAGRVKKIFIAQGAHGDQINRIVAMAQKLNIAFEWVPKQKMDRLVSGNHQGVAALMSAVQMCSLEDLLQAGLNSEMKGPRLLFLDGITDPQNVGAILRAAAFFGVSGVVLPKWRSASVTGAVIRASAGGALAVPMAVVSNLPTSLDVAKKNGFWIVGADMEGSDIKNLDVARPFCLVLGSEGEGLSPLVRKKCDYVGRINRLAEGPLVMSLNVASACAIFLHHFSS